MATQVERKLRAYRQAKQLHAIVSLYYPNLINGSLSQIINRLSPARHSPDFRSVKWFGVHYDFNATQAAIVAELWHAWELGTPKVGAGRLLSASDHVTDKVSELFKRSSAWGTMIQTDGVGNYWLNPEVATK